MGDPDDLEVMDAQVVVRIVAQTEESDVAQVLALDVVHSVVPGVDQV